MISFAIYFFLIIGSFLLFSLKPEKLTGKPEKLINFVIALIVTFVMLLPAYYEIPNYGFSQVVTIDRETDNISVHSFGCFIWEWEDFINAPTRPKELYSFPRKVNLLIASSRDEMLGYSLRYEVSDLKSFYATRDFSGITLYENSVEDVVENIIKYHLCKFDDIYAYDMTGLDNPHDYKQQIRFRGLIETYLNEELKSQGIIVNCEDGFALW